MAKYPPGWKKVKLGSVGTWLSGGTPSTENASYWGGDIPWISASSLRSFDISDSERRVTKLGLAAGARLVPAGTVLLVTRGMSLKTELRVGVAVRNVAFGQDCKAIRAEKWLNPQFLACALKARESDVLAMVDEAGHGTGRLPSKRLAGFGFGVPGLDEQHRIIDALSSVNQSIKLLEKSIESLTRLAMDHCVRSFRLLM